AGGIALGSWAWGSIASVIGVEGALLISGATLFASPVLGLWMRMPTVSGPNEPSLDILADPGEARHAPTGRMGRAAQGPARGLYLLDGVREESEGDRRQCDGQGKRCRQRSGATRGVAPR